MKCVPQAEKPRRCESHYGMPLYPDGLCEEGRTEMSKNATASYMPTPRSEFTPLPMPPSARPSHVRFATSIRLRDDAIDQLREMRREYPAIFRSFNLQNVLDALEMEE